MDELHSGKPDLNARRVFKDIKHIELGEEHDPEPEPEPEKPDQPRRRNLGRRVAQIVELANALSPPPPGKMPND